MHARTLSTSHSKPFIESYVSQCPFRILLQHEYYTTTTLKAAQEKLGLLSATQPPTLSGMEKRVPATMRGRSVDGRYWLIALVSYTCVNGRQHFLSFVSTHTSHLSALWRVYTVRSPRRSPRVNTVLVSRIKCYAYLRLYLLNFTT